ncbi:hypothetical protein NC653_018508 [Populus alba x Populus x berolinensis]|uniref:Uncharacterized protein n=1 Tax=Populus alba x Populus x berolinensis TaxID=444605 RepID=A0AAD6QGN5_9ROSI|nr:hypothetical protein NC653_018508 [Populus alba x Populus x berolinensis]
MISICSEIAPELVMCNLLVEKDRKEMMLVLVFDLLTRMMYKIYIGTRRPRGQGLVYYLCHPTFAMTGALAWQVNHYLNKIIIFVFGGEIARGFPGFSLLCGRWICNPQWAIHVCKDLVLLSFSDQ